VSALDDLVRRLPVLAVVRDDIAVAYDLLCARFADDRLLLLAGNGGSAADCDHWAGELLKGFERPRPPRACRAEAGLQDGLRAIPLTAFPAALTAMGNDVDPRLGFAQLVHVLGRPGDVFVGISTGGNAGNVCAAARTAHDVGLAVVALTGAAGGELARLADRAIRVPATRTCEVQELHLPVYHCLCLMLEEHFFGGER